MIFRQRFWSGIGDGSIQVAYRRWKRPSVKAGGTLQSQAGLLAIDEVTPIEESVLDDDAARAAGYVDRKELMANLRAEGTLYRIRFHRLGDDPRIAMRESTELTPSEAAAIGRLLQRNEWALDYLKLIQARPAVVSTELAAEVGMERFAFKARVRRLKALGLTESLEVGYRLSPRGEAVLSGQAAPAEPGNRPAR
jgi:hypothetical protein